MRIGIALGLVLALVAFPATGTDASRPPWVDGLPIIQGMKSEVGFWDFVWGSALILVAPKKFGDYWPDYGYRWSNYEYLKLCEWIEHDQPAADAYLGRVRMVTASPQDAKRLVGVELQPEEQIQATLAAGGSSPPASKRKSGLTLSQLCELFDNDLASKYTKAVVGAMAINPAQILASGTWNSDIATFEPVEREATHYDYLNDYLLMWKGLGLGPAAAGHPGVKWILDPGHAVVWEQPKHVELMRAQSLLEEAGYVPGANVIAGMEMGMQAPTLDYKLTTIAASRGPLEPPKHFTFQVTDGAVDRDFYPAANLEAAELADVTFGVWTNIPRFAALMEETNVPVWLVTENAIRHESLSPEIRVSVDE